MKYWKTLIVMIIDIFMVNMAYLFSINIVKGEQFRLISQIYAHDVIALSLIYVVCFYLFKKCSIMDLGCDYFMAKRKKRKSTLI